jgi:dipeptidyl-peptidase-4
MMERTARGLAVLLAFGLFVGVCLARPPASWELTQALERIFNRHDFDAKHFGPARWIENGAAYATLETSVEFPQASAKGASPSDIVRYETATGRRTVLVRASQLVPSPGAKPLTIENYAWSEDNKRLLVYTNSKKVWRQNTRGDYWVLDLANGQLQKLGGDAPESSLMFAKFSPSGSSVAWVRANNLYVEEVSTGAIRQLTTDGSATRINGTSDWVNEEEFDIRDGFRWSPDGQSIAYWQFDTTGVGEFTLVNDTSQEYPVVKEIPYPLVGTTNSAVRVGVVSVNGGETHWIDVRGDPRNHYIARLAWADNSNELVLEHLNRLQNTNAVLLADANTGVVRKLFEDSDPAWVNVVDSFLWTHGGKNLLWLSERDGWRHAYLLSRADGQPRLLASAPADVIEELAVDQERGWFYYLASPQNATERYLYRVSLDGRGPPERLTPQNQPGTHGYDISPDGHWAFHTYSTFDHPPVTDLVRLPEHQVVRTLENNEELVRKVQEVIPASTDFFQVTVEGGVKLDGWMIKPRGFDPRKKYPVLVYLYGEPAGVTVTDAWGGQRALFHHAIANDGYLVVSFDNQGTPAPKGRVWRKTVYGAVGVLSSAQQAEAIRELMKERSYIDPARLAVWGWSGGGSNTLNLMFRSPGLFSAGMTVAPIADQRYYDTIYQERYMGLPNDNARGYHDGSPINFAEGLTGKLLIVHGSGDDNCHYQVTEILLDRLIELGKSFDFMDYPNRTHAISEGTGTSFHLHSLLARYLEEHVPPGERPQ